MQHVFIVGAKSLGQYGGYETFVDRLINEHKNEQEIKYHIACKANGKGYMDETELVGIKILKRNRDGSPAEFEYRNAHIFKIPCPNIGAAVAIYYDCMALDYSIKYCKKYHIEHPIFYILTCRIGLFIRGFSSKMKAIGGRYYVNPDGRESLRSLYSSCVRRYWAFSEKKMVCCADLIVCDSINIEKYIHNDYGLYNTTYIAYGADVEKSILTDDDKAFRKWLEDKGVEKEGYYLAVGRFVPENNYETMIREFMMSHSRKSFVLVTNVNEKFLNELEDKLHFNTDSRIKFVGTIYNKELLKKIRECAYGYLHGHEVGGTNPSLLEGMGSTELNLLFDVGFNREVGEETVFYWSKERGNLSKLIDKVDGMDEKIRTEYGIRARERIKNAYSWKDIGEKYRDLWLK